MAKQYFNAQGVYLGAYDVPPAGGTESPTPVYDARSTLNTSTNVVTNYTDPGSMSKQISDAFDLLDATSKTKMRPYLTHGFVALSIPNMAEVGAIFAEAAAAADSAPSDEATFISSVQTVLGL